MTGPGDGMGRFNGTSSLFMEEIIRAQQHYAHIIDVSIDCLSDVHRILVSRIMFQLTNIIHNISPYSTSALTQIPTISSISTTTTASTTTTTTTTTTTPAPDGSTNTNKPTNPTDTLTVKIPPSNNNNCEKNTIALVTQYYNSPDSSIMHCMNTTLLKNLYNPCISDIYMLTEEYIDFEGYFPIVLSGSYRAAQGVQPTSKLHQSVVGARLTYGIAIEFVNTYLGGQIVIIGKCIYVCCVLCILIYVHIYTYHIHSHTNSHTHIYTCIYPYSEC